MDINNGTVHLDVSTLQWLLYVALPFVVDLVTRRFADGRVKSAVLTVVALVAVLVQEALQYDGELHLPSLLGKFVTALVTAFVTHQYVWKPLRVTGDRGLILKSLPTGVGPQDPAKIALENERLGTRAA